MNELQMALGGMVLMALSSFITRRLTKAGEAEAELRNKFDADFRAKVLADFARVLDKLSDLGQWSARQDEKINTLSGRLDALEKRQEEQAKHHREEIRQIREARNG